MATLLAPEAVPPAGLPTEEPSNGISAAERAFGLRSFPADHGGHFRDAFRNNVRDLLRMCAEAERYEVWGMPVWHVSLVDEESGVVAPLFVVEESVERSPRPFCEHCRCCGWSHHLVSKRRYHFIIPPDDQWGEPLHHDCLDLQINLLHGVLHCNGFGHLLCINGREGGSNYISGHHIMDLWDRICTFLCAREVTVEDLSYKRSMQLRLLLGVAYGGPWFAQWGYRFHHGSFGVTEEIYAKSLDLLSSQDLHHLIKELEPAGRDRELRRIIFSYVNLNDQLRFSTVRSLLCHLLDLLQAPPCPPTPATKSTSATRKRCRDFDRVAAELDSRWPFRRLRFVAHVVAGILLSQSRALTRQEVRNAARTVIGDTGLLDFVLKSLGDCVVGDHVVRRSQNPRTRVLEFAIEPWASIDSDTTQIDQLASPPPTKRRAQVERDVQWLYKHVLLRVPLGENVLNGKRWVKTWPLMDDEEDRLRYLCMWVPSDEEVIRPGLVTRVLPPPEIVVLPLHASVGDLRKAAEWALRDTYFLMEGLAVMRLDGLDMTDEGGNYVDTPLLGRGESGTVVWVSGDGADWHTQWKYEGEEGWTVECGCGARDDDGERMVACDVCETWQHTRCAGIGDGQEVPRLFLCARCAGSIVEVDGGGIAINFWREGCHHHQLLIDHDDAA